MSRSTTTRLTRASSARSPAARASSVRSPAARASGASAPRWRVPAALLLSLGLAACASYGPGDLRPGQSETEMRARLGEPTGRYPRADGASRVEYARGPAGKHTYMIDLDSAGRVQGWTQVLTEQRFDAVAIAAPQSAVREQLGRPSESRVGWRGVGEVWSYRFESEFCRWFQVWLVDGRVREAAYGSDPACEEPRRDKD